MRQRYDEVLTLPQGLLKIAFQEEENQMNYDFVDFPTTQDTHKLKHVDDKSENLTGAKKSDNQDKDPRNIKLSFGAAR